MPDRLDIISEILSTLLESAFGKVVYVIVIGLFALILSGHLKLKWLGQGLTYLWNRIFKCPRGKHTWRYPIGGSMDMSTGLVAGVRKCRYCAKTEFFEA